MPSDALVGMVEYLLPQYHKRLRQINKAFCAAVGSSGVSLRPGPTTTAIQLAELFEKFPAAADMQLNALHDWSLTSESVSLLRNIAHSLKRLAITDCPWFKDHSARHLSALTSLQDLSVESDALVDVPASLSGLRALTRFALKACTNVRSLPASLLQLPKLRDLDLAGCIALRLIPDAISGASSLGFLSLRGCFALEGLPEGLRRLPKLSVLLMGGSHMRDLPNVITELAHLKKLEQWQMLSRISRVSVLTGLTHLSLKGCRITEVPAWLRELSRLQALTLTECRQLVQMDVLSSLVWLREIDISLGTFTQLPAGFARLTALSVLRMSGSSFQQCPAALFLPSLVSLDISHNDWTRLPDPLPGLPLLETLNLSNSPHLAHIPDSISKMPSLANLDTSECPELTGLPGGISALRALEEWDTRGLRLRSLPEEIRGLASLRRLALVGLLIEALPEGISGLQGLLELVIWNCEEFSTLPSGISRLTALQILDIRGCNVSVLPEGISGLAALRKLQVLLFSWPGLIGMS